MLHLLGQGINRDAPIAQKWGDEIQQVVIRRDAQVGIDSGLVIAEVQQKSFAARDNANDGSDIGCQGGSLYTRMDAQENDRYGLALVLIASV